MRTYPSQSQELSNGSPAALLVSFHRTGLFMFVLSSSPHHHSLFLPISLFFAISSSCSSLVLCSSSYLHSIYVPMSPALKLPSWDSGTGVDKPGREKGHRVTLGQQRENWWRNVWSFLWVDSSSACSALQSSSEASSRTTPQVPSMGTSLVIQAPWERPSLLSCAALP